MYNFSWYLIHGIGITAGPAREMIIMKQMADQRFVTAQYNYAGYVEWGIGNACM
jgi:hypothetical protein